MVGVATPTNYNPNPSLAAGETAGLFTYTRLLTVTTNPVYS